MEKLPSGNRHYVFKSLEVTIRIGVAIGLIIWCLMILKPFLMITLWSVIMAVATYPLFRWLARILGNRKILASVLVTLFLLIIILLPVILLGRSVGEAVTYIREALATGNSLIPPPPAEVKTWPAVGPSVFDFWHRASVNLSDVAVEYKSQLSTGVSWFLSAVTTAGLDILLFIASVIISGVLLVYAEQGGAIMKKIAVRLMDDRGAAMIGKAEVTIRNVARGILGVAFIQSFLAGLGFLVAGIPGAGLWGLIGFALAIVQIGVGPVIIGVLIYAYIKLPMLTAILLTIYCIIPMTVDNILKPILLGRNAPVPMLVVFLGAIGGFISFGTIGLFVGAVILSLGYDLFILWLETEAN